MEEKKSPVKLIIGAIVLLALIIIGSLSLLKKSPASAVVSTNVTETRTTVSPSSGPTSLKALLASTESTRCTFASSAESADSEGVVYTAGGKMRGDFKITMKVGIPGKITLSHMIVDSQTSYMWSDGMTTGFTMLRASIENQQPGGAQNAQQSPVAMDEKTDYHCDPWSKDDAEFTPPASVKFSDMSAMMQQVKTPGTKTLRTVSPSGASVPAGNADLKAMQCGACDQAGDSKDACRAALGCK